MKQITYIFIGLTLLLFTACGQGQMKTPDNAMKKLSDENIIIGIDLSDEEILKLTKNQAQGIFKEQEENCKL